MASSVVPTRVMVSEGSGDTAARDAISAMVSDYPIELVGTPRLGTITGNRNHLIKCCETPLALLMDDDICIDSMFLERALKLLNEEICDVVSAPYSGLDSEAWFTFRGHWRPRRANEPQAASLTTLLAPTALLRDIPLDENLVYGYEEADFSLRLAPRCCVSLLDCPTVGLSNQTSLPPERRAQAESARIYVTLKRYWGARMTMFRFLCFEIAINVLRRRRPLPKAIVPHQWRTIMARSLRSKPWPWSEVPSTAPPGAV